VFAPDRSGHDGGGMSERTGEGLLTLPVRLHGIQLGRPVDLLLDQEGFRVVGLDLLCGDEIHRFLPLPTAAVNDEEIAISSPLVLLEEDELDFYRSRTVSLSALRGRAVDQAGHKVGSLEDVVLSADGTVLAVTVAADGQRARLPYDNTVRVAPRRRTAA
jgi:hypothetical protein